MRTLTVRNLPEDVAQRLEAEKQRRGRSMNQTVIDLLSQGLGVESKRSNGLHRLAGRMSEEDARAMEAALSSFEAIDDELWK